MRLSSPSRVRDQDCLVKVSHTNRAHLQRSCTGSDVYGRCRVELHISRALLCRCTKFCRPFKFYLSQESPHKQCTKERHNSTNTILNTYRKHQCFNIIRRLLAFNGAPKFQSLLWHMNPTPRTKKVLDLPNAASEKVRKTRNSHVRTFLGGINVSR